MPNPIKVTQQMKAEIIEDVKRRLEQLSLFDGKFHLDINYGYEEKERAKIIFTPMAWRKQKRLIQDFSSEVGWHGVCKRDPDNPANFIVEDIIVFPQQVTGATVVPSQKEYNDWMNTLSDEQFNNCRFHGHSHVHMQTSPSGTDLTFQKEFSGRFEGDGFRDDEKEEILKQLGDTAFSVFMILNKSGSMWAKIRDIARNVEYISSEIDIIHEEEVDELAAFMADARAKVRTGYYPSQQNGAKTGEWWKKDKTTGNQQQNGAKTGANKGAPTTSPANQKQNQTKSIPETSQSHSNYPYYDDDDYYSEDWYNRYYGH